MSSLSQAQFSGPEAEHTGLLEQEVPALPPVRIPVGLVPADQLPSAADFLAQLFPPEPPQTIDSGAPSASAPPSAGSESGAAGLTEAHAPVSLSSDETSESYWDAVLSEQATLSHDGGIVEPFAGNDLPTGAHANSENTPEIAEGIPSEVGTEPNGSKHTGRKRSRHSSMTRMATRAKILLRELSSIGRSKRNRGPRSTEEVPTASPVFPAVEGFSTEQTPTDAIAATAATIFAAGITGGESAVLENAAEVVGSHADESPSLPQASDAIETLNLFSSSGLSAQAFESAQPETFRSEPIAEATEAPVEALAGGAEIHTDPESSGQDGARINSSSSESASDHGVFSHPSSDGHLDSLPVEFAAEEQQEVVDASDDDHAIASAIERYANRTHEDHANEANIEASARQTSPNSPSSEEVDINLVLGISRDAEPGDSVLGYVVPSVQVPHIEDLATRSGPSVPPTASGRAAEDKPEAASLASLSTEVSHTPAPPVPYRDWSFEEKLASHHEWIESKGKAGKKADFSASDLEGAELIGVDLRLVDLHDASLRAADLLMADLRDACLVRANFRDACLVGANLEAANLEGASLETAMGLVPRQLAGANLHDATLPQHILAFEALSEFKRASRTVQGFFAAILSLSALSWLIIWLTKDFSLLTNSAVLPFLHSDAAASALPTQQFYLMAPLALFIVYLVFHFHLQHLWDLSLELPAVFPDGRAFGENEPRIVLGLLRTHFRWMNQDASSTRIIEKAISVFLAYWIVPATLLLYWLRFLTLQNIHGTVLQELLVVGATGAALYSTTKVGKPAATWTQQENTLERLAGRCKNINPVAATLAVLIILTFLAAGTITGVPHGKDRAPQFVAGNIRRWAPSVLWSFGVDPFADITESVISAKPANWSGSDEQVAAVKGARLNDANFRYALAYRAFLVNAHLLHANLQGAFLSQADLRGADLGQSNLRYAILDQALLSHANLDRAVLDGANLSRADARAVNLSYASLGGATLVDSRLDGATLYGAKLPSAVLIRTNFEKADLRESRLEGANLEHADLQGAYLWSSKLMGAHLNNAQLGTAIFVDADLRGADLRWAQLPGTVLTGADLAGALLDGADFRGAVGFGANQICSAKSRLGLRLDDAMQQQVMARCGLAH